MKYLVCLLAFITVFLLSGGPVQAGSLRFSPERAQVTLGQSVPTQIMIDTKGQPIGGAGVKLLYDPQEVVIENIQIGSIFADYPVVAYDNNQGRATISGISADINSLFQGSAVFAIVTWKPVSLSGGLVRFDYQPGGTRDSNLAVTTGTGDILSEVNTLQIQVAQAAPGSTEDGDTTPPAQTGQTITTAFGGTTSPIRTVAKTVAQIPTSVMRTWDSLISSSGSYQDPQLASVDPYAPIGQMQPKTQLVTAQPGSFNPNSVAALINSTQQFIPTWLLVVLIVLLVLLIAFFIWKLRRHAPATPPQTMQHTPHHTPPHAPVSQHSPIQPGLQPSQHLPTTQVRLPEGTSPDVKTQDSV